MWRFWLMAMARVKTAGTTDISLIFPGFSSGFKGDCRPAAGIDEARAINDCPAKSIGSLF